MKNRRFSLGLVGFIVAGVVINAAACGDDEDLSAGPAEATDASNDTTSSDVSSSDQSSQQDHSSQDVSTSDVSTSDVADARGQEQTGQACANVSQCYGGLDAASLKGTAVCLDQVSDGYCTHECTQDSDCCAVPGECKTGLKQVCSPFESTGKKYCFLSCEPSDIANAHDAGIDAGATPDGGTTGDQYCATQASPEFGCRSTGGGSNNRKVCLPVGAPGDGGTPDASDASDAADADGG